ncbi:hypothetical protein PsAD2_01676 [Pseudovibrio axinellae]|uniref:DUF819 family protein n=1 Tax=Pseudovibrio axinellae TaxID=989403 RepID=A0A165ZFZ0_9HYPH|nr:DUF819 family protein [Pseudovibrio axinellae]KZL19854.1 hypothetical protein PsAD2_01676 [Pseudovibrio axinellae]SER39114.1 Uncharacterized membrane protein [Pseudovibrio axinellae]
MLIILILLIIPAFMIALAQKFPLLDRFGVVQLTFAIGFVIAAFGIFGNIDEGMTTRTSLAEISVALALPMILFASNIKKALSDAREALLAMATAVFSVILVSFVGVLIFSEQINEIWQVSGMAAGAYTGGGVNMGAIKTAINGDHDIFLSMVTYDIIFSGLYLLVILFFGQKLAGLFLRPYEGRKALEPVVTDDADPMADETARGYNRLLKVSALPGSVLSLVASVLIVGASVGISQLFSTEVAPIVIILSITTLGLLGSMIPRLHAIATSFHLGMYLIMVFCVTTATMLDISVFTNINWALGGYFTLILAGSMLLQGILCRLFNVDRDTYLIASGAAIMSVPFIPLIAGALKNREILIPGIAIAVIGYALANYMGVIVATASRSLIDTGLPF